MFVPFIVSYIITYPEIGDANFKCVLDLWTFKQQLTLKLQARDIKNISICVCMCP